MGNIGEGLMTTLEQEIKTLQGMKADDPGFAAQVECVNKLSRLVMEHDNAIEEYTFKDEELKLKQNSARSERRSRIVAHVINGAAVVLPIWAYNHFVKQGFEFEKSGVITSFTFKDAIRKIRFWK